MKILTGYVSLCVVWLAMEKKPEPSWSAQGWLSADLRGLCPQSGDTSWKPWHFSWVLAPMKGQWDYYPRKEDRDTLSWSLFGTGEGSSCRQRVIPKGGSHGFITQKTTVGSKWGVDVGQNSHSGRQKGTFRHGVLNHRNSVALHGSCYSSQEIMQVWSVLSLGCTL